MKSTGIIRRIDELGRITIPMEIRNELNIEEKTQMEIFIDKHCIVLRKYFTSCIFCGSEKKLIDYMEYKICSNCVHDIGGDFNGENNKKR